MKADAETGVARIDVLAAYEGYDEDGDGHSSGFHESHFQLVRGAPNKIRDHVGTLWKQPYQTEWKTRWVPDQKSGEIRLVARIQDSRGYWHVTEPVTGLSLIRPDVEVKLYRPQNVPEDFGVRVGETKQCTFEIPAGDRIEDASEARLHLRTWHGWDGHHEPLQINEHSMPINGKNHFYDYDLLELPAAAIHRGTNTFTIHSETEHHMLEVLWPGPALTVRIPRRQVAITEGRYEERDHFVIRTAGATYWLDKRSGGLSRLVDMDGHDWIGFQKQPWDQYPASAASAYRGLPNLLFGGEESGFGHPGWDRAISRKVDETTILSVSESGNWKLWWKFSERHIDLEVVTDLPDRKFWFLYEGPIRGRWNPSQQYFATNTLLPDGLPRDYAAGERIAGHFRWVYLGDRATPRVLAIVHQTADKKIDTYSHLGNSASGLASPDGMAVLGFGRGKKGIDPQLKGAQSFRLGLIESGGDTEDGYRALSKQLSGWLD